MFIKFFSCFLIFLFYLISEVRIQTYFFFFLVYLPPRVQPLVEDHLVYPYISWWEATCPSGFFLEGPFHLRDCSSAEPSLYLEVSAICLLLLLWYSYSCASHITISELIHFLSLKSPRYCFQHSMCSINVYCIEMSWKELVVDFGRPLHVNLAAHKGSQSFSLAGSAWLGFGRKWRVDTVVRGLRKSCPPLPPGRLFDRQIYRKVKQSSLFYFSDLFQNPDKVKAS